MVLASDFQRGQKDMLRRVIMISEKHKKLSTLQTALNAMLKQEEEIFEEQEYLEL